MLKMLLLKSIQASASDYNDLLDKYYSIQLLSR